MIKDSHEYFNRLNTEVTEEIFERKAKVKITGANPGELSIIVADNSKALKELGWKVNFDLQKGLLAIKNSLERK